MWYFVLLNPGPCRPCPNGGSRAEGEDAAQPEGGHRNEPDEARRRRRSYQKTNVPIAPKLHTRLHRRRAEHERGGNRKRGMLNLSAVIVCRTQVDTCCCRRLHRISWVQDATTHIFNSTALERERASPRERQLAVYQGRQVRRQARWKARPPSLSRH